MAFRRKDRVSTKRSRQELEDDALDLHMKGYSYEGIGQLQGVSGPTAKDRIKSAQIRRAEGASHSNSKKVVDFERKDA